LQDPDCVTARSAVFDCFLRLEEVKYEMQAIHEMDDAYLIAFLKDCLDRRDFI
jgi:hypothetical protein